MPLPKNRSIKDLISGLVDKDGLKTEVTINITDRTLTKVTLVLLGTGIAIIVIANVAKNFISNHQLTAIKTELKSIKSHLKT